MTSLEVSLLLCVPWAVSIGVLGANLRSAITGQRSRTGHLAWTVLSAFTLIAVLAVAWSSPSVFRAIWMTGYAVAQLTMVGVISLRRQTQADR